MAEAGSFSWQELLKTLPDERPLIAGIVNATPDSFSDGKGSVDAEERVAFALQLLRDGADILDIGAESTRPGAEEVAPAEEWARLEAVLNGILSLAPDAVISIDTRHSQTARKALAAGAKIINDVSGLTFDPAMSKVVADSQCGVIITHSSDIPLYMQKAGHAIEEDACNQVKESLQELVNKAIENNIPREAIMLDVGIGFGKSRRANYDLLRSAGEFERAFALPFCWGVSRKSMFKSENDTLEKRIAGSLAMAVKLAEQGVSLLRVHDVAQTFAALAAVRELAQK